MTTIFDVIRTEYQRMSKRTLLLIVILTGITAGFLYLALIPQQQPKQLLSSPTKSVTKVALAHTVLSLVAQPPYPESVTRIVDLVANPHGNKVNGVQVELAYDPNVITGVLVTPGPFFPNPIVLFKTIDMQDGRISYVIAPSLSDSPTTTSGVVAKITLTLSTTATSSTTLHFLPKTKVTQPGTLESVLKNAQDLTLTFPMPTYIPVDYPLHPASPSGK